jgi:DNA-binding winged helix-turn-helix (wHTH) protein
MRLRFGDCLIDSETRELLVKGERVRLTPKAFQFLELLLENRPRALSKGQIHERLWPGTFVSDGTLTSLLAEVRSAIGEESHEPRHIRTVHRFGYAFSGTAEEAGERPAARQPTLVYRLFWGSREIALNEGEIVLGRDETVTVFLDHKSISRRHARLAIEGDRATLEDLGSKNGTFVRDERIVSATRLSDGDVIRLGSVSMTFRIFALPQSTETAGEG